MTYSTPQGANPLREEVRHVREMYRHVADEIGEFGSGRHIREEMGHISAEMEHVSEEIRFRDAPPAHIREEITHIHEELHHVEAEFHARR